MKEDIKELDECIQEYKFSIDSWGVSSQGRYKEIENVFLKMCSIIKKQQEQINKLNNANSIRRNLK